MIGDSGQNGNSDIGFARVERVIHGVYFTPTISEWVDRIGLDTWDFIYGFWVEYMWRVKGSRERAKERGRVFDEKDIVIERMRNTFVRYDIY